MTKSSSIPSPFMDAFSSGAAYRAGVFNRPQITASGWQRQGWLQCWWSSFLVLRWQAKVISWLCSLLRLVRCWQRWPHPHLWSWWLSQCSEHPTQHESWCMLWLTHVHLEVWSDHPQGELGQNFKNGRHFERNGWVQCTRCPQMQSVLSRFNVPWSVLWGRLTQLTPYCCKISILFMSVSKELR